MEKFRRKSKALGEFRRNFWQRVLIALLLTFCAPALGASEIPAYLLQQVQLQRIFEEKSCAVVRVIGFIRHEDGTKAMRFGSGFFIRGEGYVLTSASAIENTDEIFIEYGMHSANAKVVGSDIITNLAILKLLPTEGKAATEKVNSLSLGNDFQLPKTGTFLVGITCELGMEPGPSHGIVVGADVHYGGKYFPTSHLRSDMPANGGEPGSPVFDLSGNFIGVLIFSIPQINSSLILPARAVRRVINDILFLGEVRYAHIGLNTKLRRDANGEYAVVVERVTVDSPAQRADLREGDHILSIGNHRLQGLADLHDAIFFAQPDATLAVKIQRGKEMLTVNMKTASRTYPLEKIE